MTFDRCSIYVCPQCGTAHVDVSAVGECRLPRGIDPHPVDVVAAERMRGAVRRAETAEARSEKLRATEATARAEAERWKGRAIESGWERQAMTERPQPSYSDPRPARCSRPSRPNTTSAAGWRTSGLRPPRSSDRPMR